MRLGAFCLSYFPLAFSKIDAAFWAHDSFTGWPGFASHFGIVLQPTLKAEAQHLRPFNPFSMPLLAGFKMRSTECAAFSRALRALRAFPPVHFLLKPLALVGVSLGTIHRLECSRGIA